MAYKCAYFECEGSLLPYIAAKVQLLRGRHTASCASNRLSDEQKRETLRSKCSMRMIKANKEQMNMPMMQSTGGINTQVYDIYDRYIIYMICSIPVLLHKVYRTLPLLHHSPHHQAISA